MRGVRVGGGWIDVHADVMSEVGGRRTDKSFRFFRACEARSVIDVKGA